MSWISKERYYKIASKVNVKVLKYYSWLYNKENKEKDGKVGMMVFGLFHIELPKQTAKNLLPPNVKIQPTKRLSQMVELAKGN